MKNIYKKNNRGFTIIETMIAVGVFFVVVTIGMNSLLNASAVHRKSQDQRALLDNLTFIMEDIARNIRTGYNYSCIASFNGASDIDPALRNTCLKGTGIIFEAGDGDSTVDTDQWIYIFKSNGNGGYNLMKTTDGCTAVAGNNCTNFLQLNPSSISFENTSGFSVRGLVPASPLGNPNNQQPMVTIYLVGNITNRGVTTKFSLQTSVSQRLINQVP